MRSESAVVVRRPRCTGCCAPAAANRPPWCPAGRPRGRWLCYHPGL